MNKRILFFIVLGLMQSVHAKEIWDCDWTIPERLIERGNNTFISENSIIRYSSDPFDPKVIEIAISPSSFERRVAASYSDNGYRVDIYADFLLNTGESLGPSWVVVQEMKSIGVMYVHGLSQVELQGLISVCMPSTSL